MTLIPFSSVYCKKVSIITTWVLKAKFNDLTFLQLGSGFLVGYRKSAILQKVVTLHHPFLIKKPNSIQFYKEMSMVFDKIYTLRIFSRKSCEDNFVLKKNSFKYFGHISFFWKDKINSYFILNNYQLIVEIKLVADFRRKIPLKTLLTCRQYLNIFYKTIEHLQNNLFFISNTLLLDKGLPRLALQHQDRKRFRYHIHNSNSDAAITYIPIYYTLFITELCHC